MQRSEKFPKELTIESAARAHRDAVLRDLAADLLDVRAGREALSEITGEMEALMATRMQSDALATAKGEFVELGAEFADPRALPSIVCLAEMVDAVQARAHLNDKELGVLCEQIAPLDQTLTLLETELLELAEGEVGHQVHMDALPEFQQRVMARPSEELSDPLHDMQTSVSRTGHGVAEDVLLAKVEEARAENRQLRQCRWLRDVRVAGAANGHTSQLQASVHSRVGLDYAGSCTAGSSHSRVQFFTVLQESLARCSPGFLDALPRLIPRLDPQNASLAESLIRGFEYSEQLARIGAGEVRTQSSMLSRDQTDALPARLRADHEHDNPSSKFDAVALAKDQLCRERAGHNGCDLWGLPPCY